MTEGEDWGTPALSQHSSVALSASPKPLHKLHPCLLPCRRPSLAAQGLLVEWVGVCAWQSAETLMIIMGVIRTIPGSVL